MPLGTALLIKLLNLDTFSTLTTFDKHRDFCIFALMFLSSGKQIAISMFYPINCDAESSLVGPLIIFIFLEIHTGASRK